MPRKKKDLPIDPGNMLEVAGRQNRGGRVGSPSLRGYNAPRVVGGSPYGTPTNRGSGFGRTGSPSAGGYTNPRVVGGSMFGVPPIPRQDYSMVPNDIPYSDQSIMQQRGAGLQAQDMMPVVDSGGMTFEDMLNLLNSDGGGGGRSGGDGRGSGGGSYNPDPYNWRGIANYQNIEKAYQQMLDAQAQGASAVSGGFDARQKALDDMVRAESERNAGIQAGLLSAAGQARQQVGESYSQGARGLQDLAAQYGQMIAGRQPAAEQTLQAFGAGGAVSSPAQVQDMLVAQQAALGRQGQSYDALLAGRPEMYSALNAEQEQARGRQADLVRAQLLAARQQADAEAARERAQLGLQMQQALLAAQQ